MGKRGPAPKPTKLRILEGNPSKRPLNAAEPEPLAGEPRMPSDLDRFGRRVWRWAVTQLGAMQLLTQADAEALTDLCRVASVERRAWEAVKAKDLTFKTLAGYIQQRPEVGVLLKSVQIKRTLLGEFGLTPASRSRIEMPGQQETDELMEFLKRRTVTGDASG